MMETDEDVSVTCPFSADFLPQATEENWDRLRVTCTQPFNKHAQFGLSFLRLRTPEEHTDEVSAHQEDTDNQVKDF